MTLKDYDGCDLDHLGGLRAPHANLREKLSRRLRVGLPCRCHNPSLYTTAESA